MAAQLMRSIGRSRRTLLGAYLHAMTAARGERAPLRQIRRIRHKAGNRLKSCRLLLQIRNGVKQPGCIGMVSLSEENILRRTGFDDFSGVHDCDIVARLSDNSKALYER